METASRWENYGSGIVWNIAQHSLPHADHLEMSSKQVSQYIEYGVTKEGRLHYLQKIVYPTLRTIPNNTPASLIEEFGSDVFPEVKADGAVLKQESGQRIIFDGLLIMEGVSGKLNIRRSFFPCRQAAAAVQKVCITNKDSCPVELTAEPFEQVRYRRGVYGIYVLTVKADFSGKVELKPNETLTFFLTYAGQKIMEQQPDLIGREEERKRILFWHQTRQTLRLNTPDPLLNQAFDFAKLRTSESVYLTRGGLMHSPGGLRFYAAVWTNDQAEYAGPFFPWLGNEDCIQATLNCFRLYVPFMGPEYTPIPSSIISEGIDIWEGAGDRGDAAMYAYGAARFALSLGRKTEACELWKPIAWCLEYCRRHINASGVVSSDSDELENRFPCGDANLCTSSLYYDALGSAANLGEELGFTAEAQQYRRQADKIRSAIETYFGARVSGFDTYRYYAGNDCLRSWICIPLTMGIFDRKEETINALFSDKLWTLDGLATQEADQTFWDRSTLYGLRGVLYAGEADRALPYLCEYTRRRVLGEHVPYPVEAWPSGNQRQLAAESALYCRIYTEGLFGLKPIGLRKFSCRPVLPEQWNEASICDVHAFETEFSVYVSRVEDGYQVRIETDAGTQTAICQPGEEVCFTF